VKTARFLYFVYKDELFSVMSKYSLQLEVVFAFYVCFFKLLGILQLFGYTDVCKDWLVSHKHYSVLMSGSSCAPYEL